MVAVESGSTFFIYRRSLAVLQQLKHSTVCTHDRPSCITVIKMSPFWGIKTPQNGPIKSGTLKTPQIGESKTLSTLGYKNPPFWG